MKREPKPTEYKRHHYVPEWYQRRFIPNGLKQQELYHLDLKPEKLPRWIDPKRPETHVRRLPPSKCFVEEDLYATTFGGTTSAEIERLFFGEIDNKGAVAVSLYSAFDHMDYYHSEFNDLITYLSTQKLRTPKGLAWLGAHTDTLGQDILLEMVGYRNIFGAIWTECVWLIASAEDSPTKFIVSDHPVTVCNKRCDPASQWCKGVEDPDIRLNGTHTIFPMSLDKILILTNLSWVRNPYQSPINSRPNPTFSRTAIFNFQEIQIERRLSEREVREINFIIKSRARRYIAAGNKEWLFPEKHVSKSDWGRFGHGFLLMPDPRSVIFSRGIVAGFSDGTSVALDEYGRRPWQNDYSDKSKSKIDEHSTFSRFQGEFARLFGPCRRGRSMTLNDLHPEKDDEDHHNYFLRLEQRHRPRTLRPDPRRKRRG